MRLWKSPRHSLRRYLSRAHGKYRSEECLRGFLKADWRKAGWREDRKHGICPVF